MASTDVLPRAAILILIGSLFAGCGGRAPQGQLDSSPAIPSPSSIQDASPTPTAAARAHPTSDDLGRRYGIPREVDPAERYLFYLHGRIIEDLGLPAISPEFGEYRYEEILLRLESSGFVVVSEQRPRDTDPVEYARRVTGQIAQLASSGVPPSSITVVGASKGAGIAAIVSHLVEDPEVNYILLGSCDPDSIAAWKQQNVTLSGNVLAIRDASDILSGSCEELFAASEGKGLGQHAELVLQVGLGHGILYQPLEEWVNPTVQWARQEH